MVVVVVVTCYHYHHNRFKMYAVSPLGNSVTKAIHC